MQWFAGAILSIATLENVTHLSYSWSVKQAFELTKVLEASGKKRKINLIGKFSMVDKRI